jgi:hypothetical protein
MLTAVPEDELPSPPPHPPSSMTVAAIAIVRVPGAGSFRCPKWPLPRRRSSRFISILGGGFRYLFTKAAVADEDASEFEIFWMHRRKYSGGDQLS